MTTPKISVIMPAYNVENYIGGAIESILNQTFRDIELIIVNDGSTDGTANIIQKYADMDKRIIFINSKKNSGAAVARNIGIEKACGEWLHFMDGDDTIEADMYESLIGLKGADNSDILICNIYGDTNTSEIRQFRHPIPLNITNPGPTTKLYKRKLILDNNLRYQSLSSCNDVFFTFMTLASANSAIKFEKAYFHYNVTNPKSISSNRASKANNLFEAFGAIKTEMGKRGIFNLYAQQFNEKLVDCARYEWNKMKTIEQHKNFESILLRKFPDVYKEMFKLKKLFQKVRFGDGRRDIYLFGIKAFSYIKKKKKINIPHVNKDKILPKIMRFNKTGVNSNSGRNPRIIVSLTSFPARISEIHFTIYSLLTQSLKPDMVILWLGEDEFINKEKSLPDSLLKLQNNGLTIKWCKDIKSYTKLLPALKEFPDDVIISVDDDVFYMRDTVKNLYKAYLKNPEYIHCQRAHRVEFDSRGNILPYNSWKKCVQHVKPSFANFFTGVGGVLYPPHIFSDEIFNKNVFMKLAPRADDVWFWAMAVINHVKTNVIDSKFHIISVSPERDLGINGEPTLWALNRLADGNDPQIRAVMNHYKITQKDIE